MKLPRWAYTVGWGAIALAFAVLEALALIDPGKGDTATFHVRWLLDIHPLIWWMSLGAAGWAVAHFWWKKR